jgi:GWxTD domain-containing protein
LYTISVIAAETTGTGDIEFFLDGAVFRTTDGQAMQEIYIRIPNSELRFRENEGKWESLIKFSVVIKDANQKKVVDESEEMRFHEEIEADALNGLLFHTIIKRMRLAEGEYDLSCEIKDVYAPKVSLLGMVRGKQKSSKVDYYPLDVPGFKDDAMAVSGAKFLWKVENNGPNRVFHPNPSRLYGLHRDSLCVYVEAYVPEALVESRTIDFAMQVLDSDGEIVRESSLPLPKLDSRPGAPIVTYPIVIQEDINTLAAGSYTLYVNAGVSDQLMVRMRCGAFSVAWDMRTWEISRRDYLAEARFLLGDQKESYKNFQSKSLGEQEEIIDNIWKELDPDPNTGYNEAYQKFLTRLAYVKQRFSDYQTGTIRDRGLIYMRYGAPDDMEVDVVPENRESISDAMKKVDNKYYPISYSSKGTPLRYARPGGNLEVDPRRLSVIGEQGNVGYPYELWIYEAGGDPIRERDKAMEQDIGMRFIFIDTEGYGRYKLESSSIMLSK